MNTQKLKLDCIKYAAKVVATMDVENKSKALFDLAAQIEKYVGIEGKPWYEHEINASMTNTNKE